MNTPSLSAIERRTFFKQAAVLSSLNLFGLGQATVAAAGTKAKAPQTQVSEVPSHITLEQFLVVSRYLSARDQLDAEMGQKILKSLNQNPTHRAHLPLLHSAVLENLKQQDQAATREFLISHNLLAPTAREILIAWFTGVRVQAGRPVLYSYVDAQMWNSLEGIRNMPASCGGALNFWAEPPAAKP